MEKSYSGALIRSGDMITFNLHYYNTGTETATGPITIIDYLPSSLRYIRTISITDNSGVNLLPQTTGPTVTANA